MNSSQPNPWIAHCRQKGSQHYCLVPWNFCSHTRRMQTRSNIRPTLVLGPPLPTMSTQTASGSPSLWIWCHQCARRLGLSHHFPPKDYLAKPRIDPGAFCVMDRHSPSPPVYGRAGSKVMKLQPFWTFNFIDRSF